MVPGAVESMRMIRADGERSRSVAARAFLVPLFLVAVYLCVDRLLLVMSWDVLRVLTAGCVVVMCRKLVRPRPRVPTTKGFHIAFAVGGALVAHELLAALDFEPGRPVTRVDGQVSVDFVSAVIIAPLSEEPIFRMGIMLALIVGLQALNFSSRFSTVAAVIVSSVAFGVLHGPGNWSVMVPSALGGVVYAWAYLNAGTIAAPLIAHAISNGSVFAPNPGVAAAMLTAPLLVMILIMVKNKSVFDQAFETDFSHLWWVRGFEKLAAWVNKRSGAAHVA